MCAATLSSLVEAKVDTTSRGLAVALNGSVVPRALWHETQLQSGDSVEIVQARQGG